MKIILKNSTTKKLDLYSPRQHNSIRYGDLITYVRQIYGNFNFQLSYYLPNDSTSYMIANQNDLNKLIQIERQSKFLQISIEPTQVLSDKSFEQYFNSGGTQSRVSLQDERAGEFSHENKSERSEVGKFRKTKSPNEEESDVSEGKEGELLKSQVTEVIEKEIPHIANLIANHLQKKMSPIQRQNKSQINPQQSQQFLYQYHKTPNKPNQRSIYPQNQPYNGSTIKISNENTINQQIKQYQQGGKLAYHQVPKSQSRKKGIQSANYIRPAMYENHPYCYSPSTHEVYSKYKKVSPIKKFNTYQTKDQIYVEVFTSRKKSTHTSKKKLHHHSKKKCCEHRQSQSKNKLTKKTSAKDINEKKERKGKKLKQRMIEEKMAKVSKNLGMSQSQVRKWVEEYCYLEPIEIIQKIKQSERKVENTNLKKSMKTSLGRSSNCSHTKKEQFNTLKGNEFVHRTQRIQSEIFESQLKNSKNSQNSRKMSIKSIGNTLEKKSAQEMGGIFMKMKEMFGQEKKSLLFKFIQANQHLSEQKIIQKWIKLHQLVL